MPTRVAVAIWGGFLRPIGNRHRRALGRQRRGTRSQNSLTDGLGPDRGPYKLLASADRRRRRNGHRLMGVQADPQPVPSQGRPKSSTGYGSRPINRPLLSRAQAPFRIMDHFNIARFFDAVAQKAGRPYFAMELVPGVPMHQTFDDTHLSPRSVWTCSCRSPGDPARPP